MRCVFSVVVPFARCSASCVNWAQHSKSIKCDDAISTTKSLFAGSSFVMFSTHVQILIYSTIAICFHLNQIQSIVKSHQTGYLSEKVVYLCTSTRAICFFLFLNCLKRYFTTWLHVWKQNAMLGYKAGANFVAVFKMEFAHMRFNAITRALISVQVALHSLINTWTQWRLTGRWLLLLSRCKGLPAAMKTRTNDGVRATRNGRSALLKHCGLKNSI